MALSLRCGVLCAVCCVLCGEWMNGNGNGNGNGTGVLRVAGHLAGGMQGKEGHSFDTCQDRQEKEPHAIHCVCVSLFLIVCIVLCVC